MVLLGASGDLARRKVVPALLELARKGQLPEKFRLIGVSRSLGSDDALREHLGEALGEEEGWAELARRVHGVAADLEDESSLRKLVGRLSEIEERHQNRLFYLATPPGAFPAVLRGLRESGLAKRGAHRGPGWARVVIEKPFGHDLSSARALNRLALRGLDERQIYRIDHYLGKETVQNLLVFRFGNAIFEPIWSRGDVAWVELSMAEAIDIEGRGRFYEDVGVVRDVLQNHCMQVLSLCAMEPPISFEADEIRSMKAQLLRSVRVPSSEEAAAHTVFGQYEGYRGEKGVAEDSRTATYVAAKLYVDNWRWQGVPFYLRAGKALAKRVTEVRFHFRRIPFCLFGDEEVCSRIEPNVLTLRIQPAEGISLSFAGKVPGVELAISEVTMDFRYAEAFGKEPPDAYERLLLDCMRGDATLFARRDEVELSWRFADALIAAESGPPIPYAPGSAGPREADRLLQRDGHRWTALS